MDEQEQEFKCEDCGGSTHADTVRVSLWQGERLVVVEGVPARVCDRCFEQFYDQLTMFKLDTLRGTGFPVASAARVLEVPVFAFPSDAPGPEAAEPAKVIDRKGQVYDWWADA